MTRQAAPFFTGPVVDGPCRSKMMMADRPIIVVALIAAARPVPVQVPYFHIRLGRAGLGFWSCHMNACAAIRSAALFWCGPDATDLSFSWSLRA